MKRHKHGFTLEEVLITLVIIGIIAAMTIPTLMNKTNEQETVVATKKAYSILSQAWQRMIAENGEIYPETLGSSDEEATQNFGDIFVKQLNIQKNCGMRTGEDCWDDGFYYQYNRGNQFNFNLVGGYYRVRLSDGMSIAINAYSSYPFYGFSDALRSVLANVWVDVNGNKGPKIYGKDVFVFYITKYGIIPYGIPDSLPGWSLGTCRTTGIGCTAWVVTKGNMDYLRKDVSW